MGIQDKSVFVFCLLFKCIYVCVFVCEAVSTWQLWVYDPRSVTQRTRRRSMWPTAEEVLRVDTDGVTAPGGEGRGMQRGGGYEGSVTT